MAKEELSKPPPPVTVETLLDCGCFQFIIFICLQWVGFVQACNMLFMAFGKAMPPQWACLDVGGVYENGTRFDEKLQCEAIESELGCQNFTWTGTFYSIVPHWQLVCGRVKYVYLIMTMQFVGALFGSPVFGQLSDTYGRKWPLLGTLTLQLVAGASCAFAPNWQTLAALRFVVGFAAGGSIITNHVFIMEFLTRKHRLWVTNAAGWSISYMILVAIAYSTADWRKLAIITNVAGIPALGVVLFVGESPRWLLQRGRTELAERQLRRIARMNRQKLDEGEVALVVHGARLISRDMSMNTLEVEKVGGMASDALEIDTDQVAPATKTSVKKYSYWHLFTNRSFCIYIVILSVTYFAISVISNGITFNVDKLTGNMYANFAIMGGLRWCSNLIVVGADLLIKKFGRRVGLVVPMCFMCACASAVTLTHIFAPDYAQLKLMVICLSMLMAMLSPPVWIMVYLSNTELFPTPIRNISHAFCATFNRLGGVVAPQILYLAHVWKPAPFACFAGLSLIAAILYGIFIPETKGKPLPEKMPEASTSRRSSVIDHLRRRPKNASRQERMPDLAAYKAVPGGVEKHKA